MGRPRCSVEAPSAKTPTSSDVTAAAPRRVEPPIRWSSQMVPSAPTDNAALGVVLRHAVRTIPGAVLAPDAGLGAVQHQSRCGVLVVGIDGAAAQARRIHAVVAPHREIRAQRRRIKSAFDLANAPPV